MSRELKFRVYSLLDKDFIYFDVRDYPQGIAGGLSEPEQFTGLQDVNGVDIYEGDIVERTCSGGEYVVKYYPESARFVLEDKDSDLSPMYRSQNLKLIGNIWKGVRNFK